MSIEDNSDVPEPPKIDRERIEKLFKQLDINNDGRLDVHEIRRRLEQQGIDPNIAEVIIFIIGHIDDRVTIIQELLLLARY